MKISQELLTELYLNKGLNQTELGKYFNCDRKNITYYLRKYGIRIKDISEVQTKRNEEKRGFKITIEDIISRIEKGMLLIEIAEEFGVCRRTINKITKEYGYNFRNHKNQTSKQSQFMKCNNPVPKGIERDKAVLEKESFTKRVLYLDRLKNIDYSTISKTKYTKMARHFAYSLFNEKVPKGMNIDHKYSIKDGFINKVPIEIISDMFNLRLITKEENIKKNSKSIITLEELYIGVGVQRLSVKE